MECKEVLAKIDLFFEERLTDKETSKIKEHLKVCQRCRIEYNEMSTLFNILADHQIVLPPCDFTDIVLNELEGNERKMFKLSSSVYKLGLSFIAAGVLIISLNFLSLDNMLYEFPQYISKGCLEVNQKIVNPFARFSGGLDYIKGYWSE